MNFGLPSGGDLMVKLFFAAWPFLVQFGIYHSYLQALKSDDPYNTYGLHSRWDAGGCVMLSSMLSFMSTLFVYAAILPHIQNNDLFAALHDDRALTFIISLLVMLFYIFAFPIALIQSYFFGRRLCKKFPEKVKKEDINKAIVTKLLLGGFWVCFIIFIIMNDLK